MFKKIIKIIFAIILVAALVCGLIYYTGWVAGKTYQERVKSETSKELDVYKMQEYAHENATIVLKSLKKGKTKKIINNMRRPANLDALMEYADWRHMDVRGSTSFGTGSFMPKPDRRGRMDVGEQIILTAGNKKYALYVQTLVSRYGKINKGITCIAVTTFKHFNELDYAWNWQTDEKTLRTGKAFY